MGRSASGVALVSALVLASVTVAAWASLRGAARQSLATDTRRVAEQVLARIVECADTRIELVSAMARERSASGPGASDVYRERAAATLARFPGFLGLNLVDEHGSIVGTFPEDVNARALGQSVATHPLAGQSWRKAVDEGQTEVTPPVELFQGGRGFATYSPIIGEGGRVVGVFNGVFRIGALVDACLAHHPPVGFALVLRDGAEVLYARPEHEPALALLTAELPLRGRRWQLDAAPTADLVARLGGPGRTSLVFALCVDLALAAQLYFVLSARRARRVSERAAARTLRRLATVVESAADLICIVDAKDTVLYLNAGGRALVGAPPPGTRFAAALQVNDRSLEAYLDQVRKTGSGEHEVQALSGDARVPVALRAVRLPLDGGAESLVAIIGRDLRELRVLQRRLTEAEKLDALGRMAGAVAHDFNNVLAMVTLNLDAMRSTEDPEERRGVLDDLTDLSRGAGALVHELLVFSRRGEEGAPATPLDLALALRAMERVLSMRVRPTAQLSLEVPPTPVVVMATEVAVQQIVMNLVANAADACSGPQGQVSVCLRAADAEAVLEVRDTGHGMDEAMVARIFEPFFTSKATGTGLGLAVVASTVAGLGGQIDVRSVPGEGTVFTVRLPLAAAGGAEPGGRSL